MLPLLYEKSDVIKVWTANKLQLGDLIGELENITHAAVADLAERSAVRATKNLIIDIFLVFVCLVVTVASVLINRRIKRHAYHDALTGLANRLCFESVLKNSGSSATSRHAVLFLDLNRFKAINDNYGHAVGDKLLIEVARRLTAQIRSTDLLARLGGDEFAVLMNNVTSSEVVEALALCLVEAIEQVVTIQNINLKVGASIGISIAPDDCEGGIDLLRNADVAMYYTKTNNHGKVFRFNQKIAKDYQNRLILEQDLKKGIENKEFHLVYQPKVCTLTGCVKSVEALVRWSHPTRGLVSPGEFVPVAEETGLMGVIGFWVLREACREVAALQKNGLPDLQVAVNISAQQFGDENFMNRVVGSIESQGISCSSLSLEVTESIVMTDVARVIEMLKSLQKIGIHIAVDDFGTGYSSLQYLQELPLNTLKIDRAFILALDNNDPNCSVANSIVQMATLFNLETVAEGVETVEQESKVRALGVDHIQGYYYSKPVLAKELPAVVAKIAQQHHRHKKLRDKFA